MNRFVLKSSLAILIGVGSGLELAAAATVTGKYYSDRATVNCASSPCVLSFSATPDTAATVKVQNLSCMLQSGSASRFTFRVLGAGGGTISERFSTYEEIPGDRSSINLPIANFGSPMAIPKKGKGQVIFLPFPASTIATCTITGIYD